jgi:outer membrane protein OmpA-like peptidoglycan-associated protein
MLEEQIMKSKIIVLLVSCALASTGWAGQRHARKGNEEAIGVGSGAAIGAMAGGPIGLILGAAFGSWLGDRFHHERGARIEADQRAAEADGNSKALETRLVASERKAGEIGVALASERTQHRRDLEEALSVEVLFRTEDAAVTPATEERLAKLVALIAPFDGAVIRLEGHTDVRGTDSYNAALSEARADSVRDALIRAGMPPERIVVNAVGKSESQATEQDTDGMALDRRVQMSVVGLDDASRVAQQGAQ